MSDPFNSDLYDEPELDGITSLWFGALRGSEWDTVELLSNLSHENAAIRSESANALTDALPVMDCDEVRRVIEVVCHALLNETHHDVSPALIALLTAARGRLRDCAKC